MGPVVPADVVGGDVVVAIAVVAAMRHDHRKEKVMREIIIK